MEKLIPPNIILVKMLRIKRTFQRLYELDLIAIFPLISAGPRVSTTTWVSTLK